MDLTAFYQEKDRLSYNPKEKYSVKRSGLRAPISYDDRFVTVAKNLNVLIRSIKKSEIKILDIGVGDAVYENLLVKDLLGRVGFYGIDISRKQLTRAKKYLKEARVVDLNKEAIPYQSSSFDIVIASEILEHVFYPEKVLQEAARVLRPNGYLLLTYPNSGALQLRLSLFFTGASPLLNYPINKEHIRFFRRQNILEMIGKSLKLIHFEGLDSFLFGEWNFPIKIITPRILEVLGNRFFPNLALGHFMVFKK